VEQNSNIAKHVRDTVCYRAIRHFDRTGRTGGVYKQQLWMSWERSSFV